MHPTLSTPELLAIIFSEDLTLSALLHAAVTCQSWKEPALDRLWRNLESPLPLLRLLGPLSETRGSELDLVERPLLDDWARLQQYSGRVRSLDIRSNVENVDSVYQTASPFRPLQPIFHNLKTLTFRSHSLNVDIALLFFLGPNLEKLTLPDKRETSRAPGLSYIPARSPYLTELEISSRTGGISLKRCVEGLSSLKKLKCYPRDAASTVFTTCATLPKLTSISLFMYWGIPDTGIVFARGGFQKLWSLTLRMSIEDWIKLLDAGNIPPSLGDLQIEGASANGEDTSIVARLFKSLARTIPKIKYMVLAYASAANSQITFDHIQPLLSCKKLVHVIIRHPRGVAVTSGDVGHMLEAWPHLAKLILTYNYFPRGPTEKLTKAVWTPPTLPITVLDIIAAKCPEITSIGLCVHAEIPDPSQLPSHPIVLPKLRTLNLTLSTVSEPQEVALYLSDRIPANIELGWTGYRAEPSDELSRAAQQWKEVPVVFGVLQRQKRVLQNRFMSEMSRVREDLEEENRSLQMQLSESQVLGRDIFGGSDSPRPLSEDETYLRRRRR